METAKDFLWNCLNQEQKRTLDKLVKEDSKSPIILGKKSKDAIKVEVNFIEGSFG